MPAPKGWKPSPEHHLKMRQGRRASRNSLEHNAAISLTARKSRFWESRKPLSEESKLEAIRKIKLSWADPEKKALWRSNIKAAMNRPETRRRLRAARALKIIPRKDSVPELKVRQFLSSRGVDFSKHREIPGARGMGVFHVYDILVFEKKIAIEVDGCHWHGCAGCKFSDGHRPAYVDEQVRRDQEIDEVTVKLGWSIFRIWEHEVHEENFEALLRALGGSQ